MKKPLLSLFTALILGVTSFAQCNPDNSCTSRICPSASISPAEVGVAYNEKFTINVPTDTTAELFGNIIDGTINYAEITSITGLPLSENISYTCQSNECKTLGGQSGCFQITGTPTQEDEGIHNLLIKVTINITGTIPGSRIPTTYDLSIPYDYDLVVNGVAASISRSEEVFSVYPNPANDVLNFHTSKSSAYELININGSTILEGAVENEKQLDVSGLPKGYYFLKVKNATDEVIKKVIIQ